MTDRVAIVTGAAGGMGRHIVSALMADGIKVAGLDIDADGIGEIASELGGDFLSVTVDLTDPEAVAGAFELVVERFGAAARILARSRAR